MKNPTYKTIASLLFIAILAVQIISPLSAHAGAALDYDNPNKNGDNPYKVSLNGIITSGLLTSLVGCTGIVDKVAKVTTQFAQNLLTSKAAKAKLEADLNREKLNAVPDTSVEATLAGQKQQDKQSERDQAREFTNNCINGIATTLIKNQLTAMTKYTMNWINSGFSGDPLYVRDVNSFMDSLTIEILRKENSLFKDPANSAAYPYGRDYARGQVSAYQSARDTTGALRQDLTNFLTPGSTPESFATDFSQGGWNGWLALTTHPENNPLGFNLKATEDLSNKQMIATSTAKAEIDRNGGFVDQRKCVEYEAALGNASGTGASCVDNYNSQKQTEVTACNAKASQILRDGCIQGVNTKYTALFASCGATASNPSGTPKCIRYETVTPGSIIKNKVDTYINSPERQLELAKTLNDSLNALFAALINRFEDQGLSGLSSKVNNFTTPITGGFGSNSLTDAIGNNIASATSSLDNTGSSQNNNGGPFDITRDLGNKYAQPIDGGEWNASSNTPELTPEVGIQNQYYKVSVAGDTQLFGGVVHHWRVGEKAFFDGKKWQVGVPAHIIETRGIFQIQKDYLTSIKKAATTLPQVVPKLAELDYCIPGPNQNWQSNSDTAKNGITAYLAGATVTSGTETVTASDLGCFGQFCNGKTTHDWSELQLQDITDYKNAFENDWRNLWAQIENKEFVYIEYPHFVNFHGRKHNEVSGAATTAIIEKWKGLAKTKYDEYITKAKERYGVNSSMLSEFTIQGNQNSDFLPMAQAGLDMTKNLSIDAADIPDAVKAAEDNLAQSNGAVYRLGFIKDKVNIIISAAQARRKAKRIADGATPMPQLCLDNEKVTYLENGVLKQ